MDAAFLVVAGKHPDAVADRHRNLVGSPDVCHLGFRPAGHVSWHDRSGAIAFGAWQPSPALPGTTAWHIDAQQVVMTTGQVRWRNQTWLPEGQWAGQLASATRGASLRDVADRLHGVFAVVQLTAAGQVTLVTDPLGLRCVYYGENDKVVAISSKAAIVAEALAEGHPPVRDVFSTCWLAFSTYRVGTATGFEGVTVLPPGAAIEISPHSALSVYSVTPWIPDQTLQERDRDDLVELVRNDIAETLRATLELPVDRHVLRLTGGKDSRLLLAVALWAGLAKDFHYETIGPPFLADVQVASELAQTFGLRHRVRFLELASDRPYTERVRGFVTTTAGMLNVWDLSEPSTPPDEVCVVGLCGETLRTFRHTKTGIASKDDLITHFGRQGFGRLGLLRLEIAQHLHQMALDELLHDPSGRSEPLDLLDAFYFRNRLRYTRMGPQEELVGQSRIVPLYSIDALRVAFALGGEARESEQLHFEIMRRCSQELMAYRFVGPGWDPTVLEGLTAETAQPWSGQNARQSAIRSRSKSESLMQSLQRSEFGERQNFFGAVVQERANPVWELLDLEATDAALQRFEALSVAERRELYGAITAALWLDPGI
jgi:hypothetical protein